MSFHNIQKEEEEKLQTENQENEKGDDSDEGELQEIIGDLPANLDRKKKKKKKKKKNANQSLSHPSAEFPPVTADVLPHSRLLGGRTDYYLKYGQTFPPTRPVSELFPHGSFPIGEILPHGKTKYPDPSSSWTRKSEEEKR